MDFKMNLSHKSYRAACDQAYSGNMYSPTVYWNEDDGFYVAGMIPPSNDLRAQREE